LAQSKPAAIKYVRNGVISSLRHLIISWWNVVGTASENPHLNKAQKNPADFENMSSQLVFSSDLCY